MSLSKIAPATALAAGLVVAPVLAQEGSGSSGPAIPPGGQDRASATQAVPNYENAASGGAMTRGAAIGGFSGAAAGTVGGGPSIGLPSPSGAPLR